jgi:RNA polymerase sigma-70 factor (ECF subfamily)
MNDQELVKCAQEGDQTSFEELVHRYREKFKRYVRRCGLSPEEADDVVQETFARAYRCLNLYKPMSDASFSSWLYRIATNFVRDLHRQNKNRRVDSLDEPRKGEEGEFGTFGDSIIGDQPPPVDIISQQQREERDEEVMRLLEQASRPRAKKKSRDRQK